MRRKEFLREVAKRFKYIRKPLRMEGYSGGLQQYSMWIVEIKDSTVKEIGVSFWVKDYGLRTENVVDVQPSIEYVNGVPMIVKQLKEILDRDKSSLNRRKRKQKETPCFEVGEYPCKIKNKWEKVQVLYCKIREEKGIEYLIFDGSQWWRSKKLPIYEGCKKDWEKWEGENILKKHVGLYSR